MALIRAFCKQIVIQLGHFGNIHNTIPALFSPGVTTGNITLEMKDRLFYIENQNDF